MNEESLKKELLEILEEDEQANIDAYIKDALENAPMTEAQVMELAEMYDKAAEQDEENDIIEASQIEVLYKISDPFELIVTALKVGVTLGREDVKAEERKTEAIELGLIDEKGVRLCD